MVTVCGVHLAVAMIFFSKIQYGILFFFPEIVLELIALVGQY